MNFEIIMRRAPDIDDTDIDNCEARLNAMASDIGEKCWANSVRVEDWKIYTETTLKSIPNMKYELKPMLTEMFDYIRIVDVRAV